MIKKYFYKYTFIYNYIANYKYKTLVKKIYRIIKHCSENAPEQIRKQKKSCSWPDTVEKHDHNHNQTNEQQQPEKSRKIEGKPEKENAPHKIEK